MNWPVILILSFPAFIMGALSLKGLTQNKELYLWMSLGTICIGYVFFYVHSHPFFHLFIIGFLWGIFNAVVQSLYYNSYITHNPKAAAGYAKIAKSMNPRFILILIGIATGTATGLVLGTISWIVKKLLYNL